MWSTNSEALADSRDMKFSIEFDSRPATWADVISGWRGDAAFRSIFNSMLASAPYTAFRWETPAANNSSMGLPFECVVLNSPSLARRPDPDAFAEHFRDNAKAVVVFANLGGDATMIVPRPLVEPAAYGHIAAFVRLAPEEQQHALWQSVGDTMAQRIDERPVWLSTAGAGVSWLHVRLDNRPKYYGFEPYRKAS